ncbi:p450 domain-containing protein [Cephalotus follicularis]|uniref:p450 domain-containing protein n=1 Tax=Cephalotus follicularis TaxID=3775 RepID=A0A1Q3BQI7_CEPFO|nr:p450 domain-containing protein [Cephalotus follicularis]
MREDQMDFVDVLLEIKENRLINGISMGRENLKAIILDMFAAGAETTYAALEWTMAEIIRHPQVMKEAQKEIRNITGNKPHVSEEDVEKMHILKAVIKESFRLHPPIPLLVPRESTEDVRVQGFDVLAKTRVIINAWAIGRDPVWWDDPEEFRPERFLDSSIDYKGQDFQLIPFGSGRRGCPGATFTVATNEIDLANLLHKFNWSLPRGAKPEDLDVTESTGLSVRTKFPLVVSATSHSF